MASSTMSLLFAPVFNFVWNPIRDYLWKIRNIIISISSSPTQDHLIQPPFNDDILWEVLCRLPSKSLMRFKSVSKPFNSIIGNPIFAQAHSSDGGGGYRGILLSRVNFDFDAGYYTNTFYSIDNNNLQVCHQLSLKHDDFIPNDLRHHDYSHGLDQTEILKGMIGFYWRDRPSKFTLCNIATHEMLDIPIITPNGINRFYLGFDPVNLVYKILRYYSDIGDCYVYHNEICTIGGGGNDLLWRILEPPPVLAHSFQSICINGIIYFWGGWYLNDLPMIAFDLKTETFKNIPVPESANDFVITHSERLKLVQIGGRPALLYFPIPSPYGSPGGPLDYISIWMMRNNEETWTEQQRVDILDMGVLFNYVDTLPTGEMLLVEVDDRWMLKIPLKFYKYDQLAKEFENWIYISNNLSFGEDDGEIWYHEENIMRLASS